MGSSTQARAEHDPQSALPRGVAIDDGTHKEGDGRVVMRLVDVRGVEGRKQELS